MAGGLLPQRAQTRRCGGHKAAVGCVHGRECALADAELEENASSEQRGSQKHPFFQHPFRTLLPRHPDAHLTVVGCRPKIADRNCRVIGRVPLGEVPRYYEGAAVFCLPTRFEPFGIAFIEAMHHGLLVMGSDFGAMRDFIINGQTGCRVQVGDVDGLAGVLDRLLSSPEEMQRLGTTACSSPENGTPGKQ